MGKRICSAEEGRNYVKSGFACFWGFAWLSDVPFAVLIQGKGPGILLVALGRAGRPAQGVSTTAVDFVMKGQPR